MRSKDEVVNEIVRLTENVARISSSGDLLLRAQIAELDPSFSGLGADQTVIELMELEQLRAGLRKLREAKAGLRAVAAEVARVATRLDVAIYEQVRHRELSR